MELGGVSHSTIAPPCKLFRDHLVLPFTPCLQHPMSPLCHAASRQVPCVPWGSHGEGPVCAGPGRSPAPATSGMTLSGSILWWGASSNTERLGTKGATTSSEGWCFAATET